MQLDTKIVEYAQVIIDDAKMLVREDSSLSDQQRGYVSKMLSSAERQILSYRQYVSELALENDMPSCRRILSILFFEARQMVAAVQLHCAIIDRKFKMPLWSEKDNKIFLHINQYSTLIADEIEKSSHDLLKMN